MSEVDQIDWRQAAKTERKEEATFHKRGNLQHRTALAMVSE